jgi:hypothetical protein
MYDMVMKTYVISETFLMYAFTWSFFCAFITTPVIWNKNVDIKFSVHDKFLEWSSSGTLKIEILESEII